MKKIGAQTYLFDSNICIVGSASLVGEKEGSGPLGKYFDVVESDDKMGEKTFEKGERTYDYSHTKGCHNPILQCF